MKVDSLWVKLFGVEDLKQGSYSDGSFFFSFQLAILVLMYWVEVVRTSANFSLYINIHF